MNGKDGKKVMFQVEWKIILWFERVGCVVGKLSQTVGITHKRPSRKTEIIGFQK